MNFYGGNGNSSSTLVTPGGATIFNNFGVGLVGASKENLIEKNKIGGNLNGVLIMSTAQGNVVRRNIIAGNPPGSVTSASGADIQDLSAAGANTFEDNRCVNYSGLTLTNPCTISKSDDEDQDREIAFFGRNRLAFPQARLLNAVFHLAPAAFPRAAGAARAGSTDPDSLTVTGKVVDAACFMLHVAAATAASHRDCGAACLARGVPLAIATDDGTLYFPADGNTRLKSLLNAHVRASGIVVEKRDPMELKMPVGDKNQMVVRLEGGYKQITIQSLEKIPSNKRPS